MTWLVFAVSCLLVLAGAVSIISGAPIIQIERGWAEVIAGAVALSSGGVVFALAAVLMRLETVRRAIAESRPIPAPLAVAPAVPALAESAQGVTTPSDNHLERAETTTAQPAPVVEPDAPGDDGQQRHGLWKRVRRPAEVSSDVFGFDAGAAPVSNEQVLPASSVLPASEPPIDHESSANPAVEPDDASKEDDAKRDGSLSWLDRSLSRPRQTAAAPQRGAEQAAGQETAGATRHLAEPSEVEQAVDETVPVPTDEVTVVGRYQAGVASYVMYSDGTIEVETQGGELHRFASMDELKIYIAQQDSPVV